MRLGTLLCVFILPGLLLAASVVNINAISYLYFALFIASLLTAPSYLLQKRVTATRVICGISLAISFLAILFHALFQFNIIINWDQPYGFIHKFLLYFVGFQRVKGDVGKGFLVFTPPVVIFLYTLILTVLLKKRIILSPDPEAKPVLAAKESLLLSFLITFVVGLSGISYACGLQLVYFVMFFLILTLFGFAKLDLSPIVSTLSPFLLAYNIIHMNINYIYQIQYIHKLDIPLQVRMIAGLFVWYDTDVRLIDRASIYSAWILSVILFCLVCYHRYRLSVRNFILKTSIVQDKKNVSSIVKRIPKKDTPLIVSFKLLVKQLVRKHFWKLCVVIMMTISLSLPSLMSSILLMVVCIASVIRQKTLEKTFVIAGATIYLFAFTGALYIFNIPIVTGMRSPSLEMLESIGLKKFDKTWFEIGLLSLACVALSINKKYSTMSLEAIQAISLSDVKRYYPTPPDTILSPTASDFSSGDEEEGEEDDPLLPLGTSDTEEIIIEEQHAGDMSREDEASESEEEVKEPWYRRFLSNESVEGTKSTFKVLGMWILGQTYFLTLIGVYAASLQSINLLNTVYLIIFIVFIGWSKAKKAWIFLVLYCEVVVMLIFCWHSTIWAKNLDRHYIVQVIGLKHFASTTDLFIEGLLWHLLIMIFSVIQLWLLRYYDRMAQQNIIRQTPKWVNLVSDVFYAMWFRFGLIPVYIAIILVSTLHKLSIINIIYLIFTYVCLSFHMKSRQSLTHIRRFWVFIIIFSALILLSRYAFQFEAVSTFLGCPAPFNECEALNNIGLEKFSGSLFVSLLGNSIVYVVVVIQLRTFFSKNRLRSLYDIISDYNKGEEPRGYTYINIVVDFIKRFFMLHSYKICTLAIFIVCLSPISILHLLYLNMALISLFTYYGTDSFGMFTVLYSQVLSVASLIYQFEKVHNNYYKLIFVSLGFQLNGNLFHLIFGPIAIMSLMCIQRFSRRSYEDYHRAMQDVDNPDLRVPLTLFIYQKDLVDEDRKFSFSSLLNSTKWLLSNFFTLFCYQILCIALLAIIVFRYNTALSTLALFCLGVTILTNTGYWRNNTKTVKSLLLALTIFGFFQYAMNIPFTAQHIPWKTNDRWREYLLMYLQNPKSLMADFIAILLISRIRYSKVEELRKTNYYKKLIASPKFEDFRKPRTWQNSVRYIFFRFSLFVILLLIFVAGSIQADLLSLGYVFFSLFFIFKESAIYGQRNHLWRWGRLYNFIVLALISLYQVPIYLGGDTDEGKERVQIIEAIIGVRKLSSPSQMLFSIFIFILLSIQKKLFQRPEFDNVVKYILEEEETGIRYAYKKYQDWKFQRKEEFEIVQEEKLRRKKQLDILKEARHRQQKMWLQMGAIERGASIKGTSIYQYKQPSQLLDQSTPPIEDLVEDDNFEEIEVDVIDRQPEGDDPIILEEEEEEDVSLEDSEEEEEEDDEEVEKSRCSCKTPEFILNFTDGTIEYLSQYSYLDIKQKPHYSRPVKLLALIYGIIRGNSHMLCFMTFIINAIINNNLLALFFPVSMFIYALLETPRPHKMYWNFVFVYAMMITVVKILFQMSMFKPCKSHWVVVGGECTEDAEVTYPDLIGLRTLENGKDFIVYIIPDILVLIVIFIHRHWLKKNGYWSFFLRLTFQGGADPMDARNLKREAQLIETIVLKQQKKREGWTRYESMRNRKRIRDLKQKIRDGREEPESQVLVEELEANLRGEVFENPLYGMKPLKSIEPENEILTIRKRRDSGSEDGDNDTPPSTSESDDSLVQKPTTEGEVSRESKANACTRFLKRFLGSFTGFYKDVFAHKPGKDFYVVIWFIELLSFFYIMFLPSPFVGGVSANVAEFVTESRLPNSYVLTLLAQFILIVIDRVIYLFRAIHIKLIHQYLITVFYHIWIWFLIPYTTRVSFLGSYVLVGFYILKVMYLYFSGLQIMHGYPAFVQGQFLTDSKDPSYFRSIVYTGYRAIPFVYELRTLLDWTVTKTCLTFFEYLKLEDVYANLFQVKCRVATDRTWERNVGDPQPIYIKILMGAAIFFALCAIIWFPLLLLMQGSPGNQVNPVTESQIQVGYSGLGLILFSSAASAQDIRHVDSELFAKIRMANSRVSYDDEKNMQIIRFTDSADVRWSASPSAQRKMVTIIEDAIREETYVPFSTRLSFRKTHFLQNQPLYIDHVKTVNVDNTYTLMKIRNALMGDNTLNFTLDAMLPRYFRLPNQGQTTAVDAEFHNISATLKRWDYQNDVFWNCSMPYEDDDELFDNHFVEIVTISSEVPTGVFKNFATGGIIGLYIGIVLAVARFIRMSVTDLAVKIIYEDMPSCSELITYCEDIFLARQDGDLVLEEELYRELIELYRSPERLMQKTMPEGPRFKGRPVDEDKKKTD